MESGRGVPVSNIALNDENKPQTEHFYSAGLLQLTGTHTLSSIFSVCI